MANIHSLLDGKVENTDATHLDKLRAYWEANQAFPSMAKLCPVVGMTSTASVFGLVGRLVDAGYLKRLGGRIAPAREFFARPVFQSDVNAKVAPEKTLDLAAYAMPNWRQSYLIEVTTSQLASENILPGDILVVEAALPVEAGDIVVRQGRLGFEFEVVSLDYQEPTAMHPASTASSPLPDRQLPQFGQVGVAVSVLRNLKRRANWTAAAKSRDKPKE